MRFCGQNHMHVWLFPNQKLGNRSQSLGEMWIRKIVEV
jgi:hypothetical protein